MKILYLLFLFFEMALWLQYRFLNGSGLKGKKNKTFSFDDFLAKSNGLLDDLGKMLQRFSPYNDKYDEEMRSFQAKRDEHEKWRKRMVIISEIEKGIFGAKSNFRFTLKVFSKKYQIRNETYPGSFFLLK